MSSELNWKILCESYEKCIVVSDNDIKRLVRDLSQATILAAVDPVWKEDWIDTQLITASYSVLQAILGNAAAPKIMKLVCVEAQRKIDENDTSKFDIDTFIRDNRISARCRKLSMRLFCRNDTTSIKDVSFRFVKIPATFAFGVQKIPVLVVATTHAVLALITDQQWRILLLCVVLAPGGPSIPITTKAICTNQSYNKRIYCIATQYIDTLKILHQNYSTIRKSWLLPMSEKSN